MTNVTQGPKAGTNWSTEIESYRDPHTGASVRQLTNCPGADDFGYGYNGNGWYDDGSRLLFESNRNPTAVTNDPSYGSTHPRTDNFFAIDVETGTITQLTDIEGFLPGGNPSIARDHRSLYFWVDAQLVRMDLDSLRVQEVLYEVSDGYQPETFDLNADESRLFVAEREPFDGSLGEVYEAEPHTRILSVPVDGGDPEVVFEDDGWWSTHVDASPTDPALFLHPMQGPWSRIDDKLWVQNVETSERWSVRTTPGGGGVGHQSWQANGTRVNYQGWDEEKMFFGHAKYNGSEQVETTVPDSSRGNHPHANGPEAFVSDGGEEDPWVLYYRWNEDAGTYDGPRKLATLNWNYHPHPRLSPDGTQVQFNMGHDGASSIYLVDIPSFESLPKLDLE